VSRTVVIAVLVCVLGTLGNAPAVGKEPPYTTGFTKWRAVDGGFTDWQRDGVALAADGTLSRDPATADPGTDPYPPGTYNGRNYYNGGSFFVGEATSPIIDVSSFTEAIASWNAATPAGTWVETQIRADVGDRWTKWYILGVWAADTGTVERHSVQAQGDADGFIAVDTLVLAKKVTAASLQLKLRLFSEAGAVPSVRAASVATSTTPGRPSELTPGDPALWDNVLAVPECSQMVYPDGGEVWCSPTSTSMVLAYWQNAAGPCEPRVRAVVEGVFDWVYDGHGNWPFNTAYAAAQGLEGYVARFRSMAQLEPWIAAGVPVVISYAWKKSELTGAPIPSSNGHLAVVAGFDAAGNPVVNDPAASSDDTVQRTYLRSELESLWLKTSGGTAYLMFLPGHAVPPL
jgi:hypothetical protein